MVEEYDPDAFAIRVSQSQRPLSQARVSQTN